MTGYSSGELTVRLEKPTLGNAYTISKASKQIKKNEKQLRNVTNNLQIEGFLIIFLNECNTLLFVFKMTV